MLKFPVATPTDRAPLAAAASMSFGVSPMSTVEWPEKSAS